MATLTKPAIIQAYSYSRFSSSGQRGSISIPRQIERARAYAKQEGWTLDESLRDEKTSAFKGKHRLTGDLAKFLKLIQTGKVQPGSFLIVEAMDRLSREKVSVALSMFLQIITAGVGIVTLVDNRRYTVDNIDKNPYELMGSIALMAAANEYSSKLSDRVKDAYQRDFKAAKSGKGRILAGSIPYWIQIDGGKLVFHPERAQVMRKVVGWAMTGWGVEKIAKALTAARIPTATKLSKWNNNTLSHMLRSRRLLGEFVSTITDETIPNYFPALLTPLEFAKLQAQIDSRVRLRGRIGSGQMTNIFGKLLTCGFDGSAVKIKLRTPDGPKGRKYVILHSVENKMPGFPMGLIEEAFYRFCAEVQINTSTVDDSELILLKGQQSERRARLVKLTAILDSGEIENLTTVAKQISKVEGELRELTKMIDSKEHEKYRHTTSTSDIVGMVQMGVAMRQQKNTGRVDESGEVKRNLKLLVADLCKAVKVWVFGNVVKRVAVIEVIMRDGEMRMFAVRMERRKTPIYAIDFGTLYPEHYSDGMDVKKMGSDLLEMPYDSFTLTPSRWYTKAKK